MNAVLPVSPLPAVLDYCLDFVGRRPCLTDMDVGLPEVIQLRSLLQGVGHFTQGVSSR